MCSVCSAQQACTDGRCADESPDGGDAGSPLCANIPAPCVAFPQGTTESTIDTAFASASANTTFVFDIGAFSFSETLSIPALANLTIQGQGANTTSLDFANQTAGSVGIAALSGNTKITFHDFAVVNTPGEAIQVKGANGIIFEKVNVNWLDANALAHGANGLHPVQSQNILIDGCEVSGARDTGIYVGESFNIIVSNNSLHNNVAGIEIESSINADVHDNVSTQNSAGILVFTLPGLVPPPGSGAVADGTTNVRVYDNMIAANNTANFADPSGVLAAVPGGTGLVILASENIEIFGNTITNNNSVGYAVISYLLIDPTFDPTNPTENPTGMNPFPSNAYAHDNSFSSNGDSPVSQNQAPGGGASENQLGELLAALVELGAFPSVPDMVWDGIANEGPPKNYVPPAKPIDAGSAGTPPNPDSYWIQDNGTATFVNLNFPVLLSCGNGGCLDSTAVVFNAVPFTVTSPPAGFPLPATDAGF
jgi:parallel beta-helix repeat protein